MNEDSAMNAPRDRFPDAGTATYVFVCADPARVAWMTDALAGQGVVVPLRAGAGIEERIGMLAPQAVLIDFGGGGADDAAALLQRLRQDWPALPVAAAGLATDPAATLGALRAGVDDFIDLAGAAEDAQATLRALMQRRAATQRTVRGGTIALLGARAGVGTTTLATSLALLLQEQLGGPPGAAPRNAAATQRRGVALLDLGLPARDALLYLDTPSEFSFVDGVRNLRRIDPTLLQTALAHHDSGVALLPLPTSLAQVREISHADSAQLIRRLADFFDLQVADLGGFSSVDFIAQTAREADHVWVVCDQSIGAIVSTAALLKDLKAKGVDLQGFALVVNKFDSHVELSAREIAARLELPLAHVVPARAATLNAAASRGEMLVRTARSDAYTQAVAAMARSLRESLPGGGPGANAPRSAAASPARWRALGKQIGSLWKKEG